MTTDFQTGADHMTAPAAPVRLICIGTHHKTGTLWMRWVFRAMCYKLGLPFGFGKTAAADEGRNVIAHWSSDFAPETLSRGDMRGLHLIRDPRDVLISGARYHARVPDAREPQLASPDPALGGKSYLAHMRSLPDLAAQLRFEMAGRHAQTMSEMTAWDYSRDTFAEIRYEDLMADQDGALFADILHFLGFDAEAIDIGRACFLDHSLFGSMTHRDRIGETLDIHIDSGAPARWRDELPRAIAEDYAETFGADLVALGYETHPTNWVQETRP